MAESCWGCGRDYLHCWTEDDLTEIVTTDGEVAKVCPDCHEELTLQDMIMEE